MFQNYGHVVDHIMKIVRSEGRYDHSSTNIAQSAWATKQKGGGGGLYEQISEIVNL